MEITLNTPALLFPAISLLLLAYTNRFVALSHLVRKLHAQYKENGDTKMIIRQISTLRRRINYIRYMQGLGVFSFLLCIICMYCIYLDWYEIAKVMFALSLIGLMISLVFSLIEIIQSMNALELELSDMEGLDKETIFPDLWNKGKSGS